MAHNQTESDGTQVVEQGGDRGKCLLRRCRGRPRLTDSDRAQRRLESRKKYDIRRVYLGESHKLWSDLRRRTSLSDAGLAAYLIVLHSTFGEKYQQKLSRKTINSASPEDMVNQRKVKRDRESSLHSLMCWYQEHLHSCPHEPQLRALEPRPNFSTAAIWQCVSDHSFVQHLFSPLMEASDSEGEERENGEGDGESAAKTDLLKKRLSSRKKKTITLLKDLGGKALASEVQQPSTKELEQREVLTQHANVDTSSNDVSLTVPPVWEMEMELERPQGSPETIFHVITSEEEVEDVGEEAVTERLVEEQEEGIGRGYECGTVGASFSDKLENTDEGISYSVPPSQPELMAQSPDRPEEKGELFDPQTLQTVVTSCEIPDHQTALEGSQLIIITGPSYEGFTPGSIHFNVGAGNVEEDTCTIIKGVTSNQVCDPESKSKAMEDEDCITGLDDKQLLQPTVDNLELSNDRELKRSLSRSKRNRRGPVIEADGMLKMFHCPYEGCSQVYVAISSFQNHVNLVHRKGRTKVCPHPGCGKKFYLSNHLHRHMIIHSGVRDFICETCGKSFKRKNHLEVHRRTHTGETPLQCEICGYQCRQRASLNWHMKKHTSEAHYNYTCEFCNKRFEKLDSVKFHKLKSHPEKLTT
ncbi:zinc finger protein 653 isoform X1 [Corythoichthys intestinalis]|uniref:zinc finger protein 653 isoform X1 n=1 Tax=Corythoichthys intestinalis TaxID=161448 RepID=UPI0025A61837|nr:zinc finger protein 653 isoform X1 [Corythoichthys intestinalis]